MKKYGAWILMVVMLVFTGCGDATAADNETTARSEIQNAAQRTEKSASLPDAEAQATEEVNGKTPDFSAEGAENMTMKIQIGETFFTAALAENTSAEALLDMLKSGPVTIEMQDYAGMEKVGPLGVSLPRNDEQITAEPGDIILYQGNVLVIYYAQNSWNFTRIGKIENITEQELKEVLGEGDVAVTFFLE